MTPDTLAPEVASPRAGFVDRVRSVRRRGGLGGYSLIPILVLVVVVGAITVDGFFTRANFIAILQQSSELAVVTLALTIALLAGKIDLSLESTIGIAPLVAGWLVLPESLGGGGVGLNPYLAILACLGVGVLIGVVNAAFIVKLRLNAFVVTLAMLILLRGVHLGITNGGTLYDLPDEITFLGSRKVGEVPVSVLVAIALFVLFGLFLRYHRIGRALYAVGGNADAARAAGVNVERVLWGTLIVASLLAALAGLMLSGRLGAVTPEQGKNYIFTVFAAAVIGGVSLAGGRGTLFGAFTGVILLGVVSNLLILSQVPSFWIEATYGAIILVALILASFSGRERDG